VLLPKTLRRLWETWSSIPENYRNDYVGITALAATELGIIVNPFPGVGFKDVSWNDLAEVHHITTDMVYCARADVIKAHPFPEVDMVIPESVVWTAIGHRPTRLIPEVLKFVEYGAPHAISFSNKMSYNRGRAYALATTERNLSNYQRSWKVRAWRLIIYIRYCMHGDVTLSHAREMWGSNSSWLTFSLAVPIAWFLGVKDHLQGKVNKTHLEFFEAQKKARFTAEVLGHCE
jgi:hypothetical protein